MKRFWVIVLVLLVSIAVCSASGLASVAGMKTAIKHNPVITKLVRGTAVLGTGALLLMPIVPVEVLAKDVAHPAQLIQQSSPAKAKQDLISLHEIYREYSYREENESDYQRLKKLLEQGKVDVNARDEYGNTVLLKIIVNYPLDESKAYKLMRLLLVHGADPEAENDAGESAYSYIASGDAGDDPELLGFMALLSEAIYGINGGFGGSVPLDYALRWARYLGDTRLAKKMVARGADVRLTEKGQRGYYYALELGAELADGEKFLTLAAEYGGIVPVVEQWGGDLLPAAVSENNGDVVKVLLDHGTDPSAGIFHAAQIRGIGTVVSHVTDPNATMLATMLNRGADANAIHPENGFTAMHVAAYTGNYLGVETLLKHGGNPSIVNAQGWTALHAAAEKFYSGFGEAMRIFVMTNMLMAHDVDALALDNDGYAAYDYVVKKHRYHSADEKSPLAATAAILLQAMGGKDGEGRTATYWAELSGSKIVQELIAGEGKFIPMSGGLDGIRNTPVIQELIKIRED